MAAAGEPVIVQISFPWEGPWREGRTQVHLEVAYAEAKEPGLLWKIWTECEAENTAGGVFLFSDRTLAEAYLERRKTTLPPRFTAKVLDVNVELSLLNRAPLGSPA